MAFGWLKKLAPLARVGARIVDVGAELGLPGMAPLDMLIEGIERAMPGAPGATKKSIVEGISEASIELALEMGWITAEQAAAGRALRSAAIDDYVAYKNLEAKAYASKAAYDAFVASFKSQPPAVTATTVVVTPN